MIELGTPMLASASQRQSWLSEGNAACSLKSYRGGYRCCMDGVFVTENPDLRAPADKIQAKFTFEYYVEGAVELARGARSATAPSCCDASGPSVQGAGVEAPQMSSGRRAKKDLTLS